MASEQMNCNFNALRFDLMDALDYAKGKRELLASPDYSTYCDPENRILLEALFDFAEGNHSWVTFITAVCTFGGDITDFMNSEHIAH